MSGFVIMASSGAWKVGEVKTIGEGQEPSGVAITPSLSEPVWTEASVEQTLEIVSRRVERPVGENIRSAVRTLRGSRKKGTG